MFKKMEKIDIRTNPMPKFSNRSNRNLESCHEDLQVLFNEVIRGVDCTIIQGHRTEAVQNQAFDEGRSQLRWPNSLHNSDPSAAVDVIKYPIDWSDTRGHCYFAGYVLGLAGELLEQNIITHKITWGGNWKGDHDLKGNGFADLVHFQLIPAKL